MNNSLMPTVLTVSQLNTQAKQLLENCFQGVWVSGEVSNLTKAASGHYYFALKDQQAQVRCALFKFIAQQLPTPLKEGDHLEVRGKISIYEARGEFQITVQEVRQIGLGQLYERYEKLKLQLQQEGLFAPEHKKRLPEKPRKIGVVTSLAAAALRDVVTTLKRRAPHIPVIVYPTAVQGIGSEQQIAATITQADKRAEVDILIVCRGGGSIEDLWSFNEEIVVRTIAACQLPIVSGVGHETDFTLTDFVADVRAPTPTAAAEIASPNIADFAQKVKTLEQSLYYLLTQYYQNISQKIDFLSQKLLHPKQKLELQANQLSQYHQQLQYLMQQRLSNEKQNINQATKILSYHRPNISQYNQPLLQQKNQLQHAITTLLTRKQQQLTQQHTLLEAISPQKILTRGFAVVKDAHGNILKDAQSLKLGQKLKLVLAKGQTDVQVIQEQTHKQPDLFE